MKKILTLLITVLVTGIACAQSVRHFYFADTAIEIFAEMRDSTISPPRKANMDGPELIKSVLENSVRKEKLYERVEMRLKEFKTSKDEGIRHSAIMLSSGVLLVHSANGELSSYLEKLLNNPKLMLQQGTVSRKMAELNEASASAWQTYAIAASSVSFALTDGPKSLKEIAKEKLEQRVLKLVITKSQIEQLKDHLQRSFGPIIADDSEAGFVDLPAIRMFRFLEEKWIPATEK
jgi:hypothetical protein